MTTLLSENSLQRLKSQYRLDKARTLSQLHSLPLIQYHPAQTLIAQSNARYKVVSCGRKFGKTRMAGRTLIERMMAGQYTASLAPSYEVTRVIWEDLIETLPAGLLKHKDASRLRLTLTTGGTYQAWSMDTGAVDKVRPHSYHFLVIDEASFVSNLVDAWQKVLSPTLTIHQGSALFLSTPNGLNGFHTLYQWGIDPDLKYKDWQAFHFPTLSNPHIPPDEIETQRMSLPDMTFRQEYLAEFIEDGAGVFRGVVPLSRLTRRDPYPGRFVFGLDWAQSADFTVISVMDLNTREQVDMERFNQVSWQVQRDRVTALYDKWKPERIIAESNSIGSPNIEALYQEGLPMQPFTTTAQSKATLIQNLTLMIERAQITLLDDPVQRGELQAYAMERLPSGMYRYNAPSGQHDDTVMALALACYGVTTAVPDKW